MRFKILSSILFLSLSHQKGCLNDHGTYQINVKLYADKASRHLIAKYVHKTLPKSTGRHSKDKHQELEEAYVKHYFRSIFNEVNLVLKGTNVQFKTDFSDFFKKKFSEMHNKYCAHFANITQITENFLSDFDDPHADGENRVLIVDCVDNNAYIPTNNHMTSKNQCGKIHGILLTDPEVMRFTIAEGLYNIFTKKSISQVQGVNKAIQADICSYIQFCNRNYNYTGVFLKDTGVLRHKTFTDSNVIELGHNIGTGYVKNFGHSKSNDFFVEESSHYDHEHSGYEHFGHGHVHHRHQHHHHDEPFFYRE
ncbi:hypothetical protein GINT2_000705 [Glugoides intestinalis]